MERKGSRWHLTYKSGVVIHRSQVQEEDKSMSYKDFFKEKIPEGNLILDKE